MNIGLKSIILSIALFYINACTTQNVNLNPNSIDSDELINFKEEELLNKQDYPPELHKEMGLM